MTRPPGTTPLPDVTYRGIQADGPASVDLYWLPLGAGEPLGIVQRSGKLFEAIAAHHQQRNPCDLYHSALKVHLGAAAFVIEMAPVWGNKQAQRGVVGEGAVGLPWLRDSRFFRYEIRRWESGVIPDLAYAVASPRHIQTDAQRIRRLLAAGAQRPRHRRHRPAASWARARMGGRIDHRSAAASLRPRAGRGWKQ